MEWFIYIVVNVEKLYGGEIVEVLFLIFVFVIRDDDIFIIFID